ncbi:hypothetical protein AG4045_027905 [Apium graveolens]|uniref:TF-B3 domain-containing protein n=1 Tax=Apium graveolens TaxID=4045 RepID=A0A6L5B972_APIGR|nr:hypothetical protein AG4045_027905 [Apium graveolens]
MDVLCVNIPLTVYFMICTGYEAVGSYSQNNIRIKGLENVCNMLDALDFSGEYMLLFVFDGVLRFRVKVFENSQIETPIGQFLRGLGEVGKRNMKAFYFEVKDCHMRAYEYGVDITAEYRNVCQSWLMVDHISAYVGFRCWTLQTRHRHDRKRFIINDGWLTFRLDNDIE